MTEQAKPTPGPWRDHVVVLSRNNQKGLLRQENTIVRRGADVIAMVFGVTADEEKANARLHGCAYVNLDFDGPVLDDLPAYGEQQ